MWIKYNHTDIYLFLCSNTYWSFFFFFRRLDDFESAASVMIDGGSCRPPVDHQGSHFKDSKAAALWEERADASEMLQLQL